MHANSGSRVCICILCVEPSFILGLSGDLKGSRHREGASPRPDAGRGPLAGRTWGFGGGRRGLGRDGEIPARTRPRAPGTPPGPSPDPPAEGQPPPSFGAQNPPTPAAQGEGALPKPLATSHGYATPARRRRPRSLTAHPPAPPASPLSSDHSTLLSPRLL